MRRWTDLEEIKLDPLSDTFELIDDGLWGNKSIIINLLAGRRNPLPLVIQKAVGYMVNMILREGGFNAGIMRLYARLWITIAPGKSQEYVIIVTLLEMDGCDPYEKSIGVLPGSKYFQVLKQYILLELCYILFGADYDGTV